MLELKLTTGRNFLSFELLKAFISSVSFAKQKLSKNFDEDIFECILKDMNSINNLKRNDYGLR